MKHYISEVITLDEIKKWKPGQRILISSMTGSGKSEMIKNQLYDYAKSINKKILLLSNRNLLKQQNIFDLKDKTDFITIENYQAFESRILRGIEDIESLFEPYYFIAEDEGHYCFADSSFNDNTDLLIQHIKNTPKNKIFIFLTATPDALMDYQPNFDYVYNIPKDYSYIKNIYFYDRNNQVDAGILESIIRHIPEDEKILYFGSNSQDIYNLSTKFENASFICSQGNKLKDKSDNNVMLEIERDSKFSPRALFATKVLDNGVNIKDRSLKHIIIDTHDIISLIQTLGRKRSIDENDTINLYIRNYRYNNLKYMLKGIKNKLKKLASIEKIVSNNIESQYPDYEFDDEIKKYSISKYQHYKTQERILEKIINNIYKDGEDAFAKYVCSRLDKDFRYAKDAFFEFEKMSLKEMMEKYIDVKMFKDNQEIFKNRFFTKIFTSKKTDYRFRGIVVINRILEEDGLKYNVVSRREWSGSNKGKFYWTVEKRK